MNVLVVFYSWSGHTETLAKALGEKLGAGVTRIEPLVDPGKELRGMGKQAFFGKTEAIKPIPSDMAGIDHLVIATPVWAFNLPPFTRQYLEGLTNCSGKKFSVLVEMGGIGGKRVVRKVRGILESKGMQFVASAITVEKQVNAGNYGETLSEFARKVRAG